MIVVRFTSGLGNQMFQYSFYRLMQETYPDTEVKADLTWFYANNDHHGYELDKIFAHTPGTQFQLLEASKGELMRVTGLLPNLCSGRFGKSFEKFRRYPNRILREVTGKNRNPYCIDRLTGNNENIDVLQLDTAKDWYIIGFWIEEKYYLNRIKQLQRELIFDNHYSQENAALAQKIKTENAVSLHVRRGDYLKQYADMFAVLDRSYYEAAVSYIKEHVEAPHFYVFSDDSNFVEQEFDWLSDKTIVSINTGSDSFRDMQLMSLCKHNIIANSTFSQWGALLNQNEASITVYPAAYLKNQDNEIKQMKGWVRK